MPQHLTFDYLIRVGETIPISLDYGTELGDDTIQSSSWTVPTGTTLSSSSTDERVATLWITGVTAGAMGVATNTLASVGGKVLKRSRTIRVVAA